jgi:LysM repeat protein
MSEKDSPMDVIESYRKRQRAMPFIIGVMAVLLVVAGIVIVVMALKAPGNVLAPKPTETITPTSTSTSTPVTPTITPTATSTKTNTPTITNTATPSGPFEYTILEGDNCWSISQKFNVDLNVLLAINNLGGNCPIIPGNKLLIPTAGIVLPSSTPIPANLPKGTKLEYYIQVGDTLEIIAAKFNSTVEAIMAITENNITNANDIKVGQKILVPVNIATPTPTRGATSTVAFTIAPKTATATTKP